MQQNIENLVLSAWISGRNNEFNNLEELKSWFNNNYKGNCNITFKIIRSAWRKGYSGDIKTMQELNEWMKNWTYSSQVF